MLDILKFIFSSGWVFSGTLLLLIFFIFIIYAIGDCFIVNICNTFIKYFNVKYVLPNIKEKDNKEIWEDK